MAIVSRGDGDLQMSMYVLFSKVFEDRPCLPEDFDYSILSELRDAGELPVLTVARPQMHPPIAEGSDFSALRDLVTTLHGGASFEDHSEKPVFHGTEGTLAEAASSGLGEESDSWEEISLETGSVTEDDSSASADGALDEGLPEGPYDDGWQNPDDPVPQFPGRTWLSYFGVSDGVNFTEMD